MEAIGTERVVGRIYEAVSDTERWRGALEDAREFLDADAMLLLYCNLSMGRPQVIASTGFDVEALGRFAASHLEDDELVRESMRLPVGVVVSRTYSIRDAKTRTTFIRRSISQVSDRVQIAGAAAIRESEVYSSLWMARCADRPAFSCRDLHLFGELLPHVGRAMTVHHRVTRAELEATMATGAIDRMAVGMVLLDATGQVVIVNREAERIFALEDGIGMIGRRLIAVDSGQTTKLRRVIRRVGDAAVRSSADEPTGGAAVRIARLDGRPDYHVVVIPLPRRCQPRDAVGAVAVLFITDPERGQTPVDFLCGDLYGLTGAEVRLVSTLLESAGLTAAAKKLGLSRNTVHSQLASVFQKTGTRSQSELLRLVLGGIAPIKAPDVSSGFTTPFRDTDRHRD